MTSFYGQGFNYPVSLDITHGILMSSNLTNIEQSIYVILGTQYGERVMRPTFGCNLKSLVFAPNNPQTAALAKQYVTDGLQTVGAAHYVAKRDGYQSRLKIRCS